MPAVDAKNANFLSSVFKKSLNVFKLHVSKLMACCGIPPTNSRLQKAAEAERSAEASGGYVMSRRFLSRYSNLTASQGNRNQNLQHTRQGYTHTLSPIRAPIKICCRDIVR